MIIVAGGYEPSDAFILYTAYAPAVRIICPTKLYTAYQKHSRVDKRSVIHRGLQCDELNRARNIMNRRENISCHIQAIAEEILGYIRENESQFSDRWVPAAEINKKLDLKRNPSPKIGKTQGCKQWFFSIIARILEDQNKVEYKKVGNRAYYRCKNIKI